MTSKHILLVLLLAVIFIVRLEFFLQNEEQRNLLPHTGAAIIEGVVVNDPERRATALHAHVEVARINGNSAQGKLLAILPRETELFYNDRITLRGRLEAPERFETDTGRVFDYSGYLRAHGISARMQNAVLVKAREGGRSLQGALFGFKHSFEAALGRSIAEPRAALLGGIVLGEKRGLPDELMQAFVTSGLVHVVVLSGYNISIVALVVFSVFGFLPRRLGLLCGVVAMVMFVLLVGAGATAVRALLMGLIGVLAQFLRRPQLAMRALAVAASAMLFWNPFVWQDPSFVLSVVATFGLITLSPAVERRLQWIPEWKPLSVRSIASSTVAVQIFILPALLYYTGILSLVSLPANIVALPVVAYAMFGGFITGFLGMISDALALLPALVTDLLLRWILTVAGTAVSLPFASTVVSAFPFWIAGFAYVPLTIFAIRLYRSVPRLSSSSDF